MRPTNDGKPYYCRSYRLKPSIVDKLKRLSETTGLSQTDCVSQAILLMSRVESRRAERDFLVEHDRKNGRIEPAISCRRFDRIHKEIGSDDTENQDD